MGRNLEKKRGGSQEESEIVRSRTNYTKLHNILHHLAKAKEMGITKVAVKAGGSKSPCLLSREASVPSFI